MTVEGSYFRDLARLRAALERALAGEDPLPDYLTSDGQPVSDGVRAQVERVRDALVRGDVELLRRSSAALAAQGFDRDGGFDRDRDADGGDVPELDAARRRVLRRARGEADGGWTGRDRTDGPA